MMMKPAQGVQGWPIVNDDRAITKIGDLFAAQFRQAPVEMHQRHPSDIGQIKLDQRQLKPAPLSQAEKGQPLLGFRKKVRNPSQRVEPALPENPFAVQRYTTKIFMLPLPVFYGQTETANGKPLFPPCKVLCRNCLCWGIMHLKPARGQPFGCAV